MRSMIMVTVLAVLLAGCAKSQEVYFADGKHRGYQITCEGIEGGMAECFRKAGAICGEKNFDITHKERTARDTRSLLVRCRTGV